MTDEQNKQPEPINPPTEEVLDAESPAESPAEKHIEEPAEVHPEPPEKEKSQRGKQILIGSQRDPAKYRPRPRRDWKPIVEAQKTPEKTASIESTPDPTSESKAIEPNSESEIDLATREEVEESLYSVPTHGSQEGKRFPPPNIRAELSDDLEAEFQQALGGDPLEDLMDPSDEVSKQTLFEPESKHTGRVVAIHREDVFVELGGREQGIVPLAQFDEMPEPGAAVEVRVVRFNNEDGLYELALPGVATEVADWSDLEEGMTVEALITGHNTGGLECEVNRIRGFIPISQISLYRVENLEEFLGEKFACLVNEANPDRRNLVLSRRAILEREREEARQQLLESLAPGQIHEGVVRKLMDFGAFVDLGGVDGLLHISKLSWSRVNHPSDVLEEGQKLKVRIDAVDPETGRISLSYRDMLENPWDDVEMKYPVTSTAHGRVTKLMEFGAFVELEPGVEGLVHISELSHKRVWRPSEIVKEGEEVDVSIVSVDREAQRIGLSMKDLLEPPEPVAGEKEQEPGEPAPTSKKAQKPTGPLKGGLGKSSGGEQFGLKW